jgi:hypothetical protein
MALSELFVKRRGECRCVMRRCPDCPVSSRFLGRFFSSAILVMALTGCTTARPPGLPSWDYEQDQLDLRIHGDIVGRLSGILSQAAASATSLVGALQGGIGLTPSDLNAVILHALTPSSREGASLFQTIG